MIYTEVTETVQNGDFGAGKYPPPYVLQFRPAGLKICAQTIQILQSNLLRLSDSQGTLYVL